MEGWRCYRCRHELGVAPGGALGAHGAGAGEEEGAECQSVRESALVYLREEALPGWVRARVEAADWLRGKLHCESCGGKLGSFDFVSGRRCACGARVLPPVHLVRSQLDAPRPARDPYGSSLV